MFTKIFLLSVLIAGISMSTASPVAKEEEIPERAEPTVPVEMNITETELLGNESSLGINVYSQFTPSSRFGYLTVVMVSASGLPDTDGWWNLPDPYVIVYAHSSDCSVQSTYTQYTHVVGGTQNPSWHTSMKFGWGDWVYFSFQVWDSDINPDDEMTGVKTVYVNAGDYCGQVYYYGSASVTYNYYLQTPDNACSGASCS